MTRLRQTIARRLKEAQDTAALLTTFNDCDMSAVMAARDKFKEAFEKKHGVKLGFMSFFAKAACLALKDIPAVNAQIQGDEIVYFPYVDLSVAVSAPNGLVVPVVRNADQKTLSTISNEMKDLAKRARDRKLKPEEYQGGTSAVSNLGMFGIKDFSAVINPPHSSILAVGAGEQRVIVKNGQPAGALGFGEMHFEERPMASTEFAERMQRFYDARALRPARGCAYSVPDRWQPATCQRAIHRVRWSARIRRSHGRPGWLACAPAPRCPRRGKRLSRPRRWPGLPGRTRCCVPGS